MNSLMKQEIICTAYDWKRIQLEAQLKVLNKWLPTVKRLAESANSPGTLTEYRNHIQELKADLEALVSRNSNH